jgi:alkyl sulfatase BDS1-like metallo-beta-lactamase superfamily hydrolase
MNTYFPQFKAFWAAENVTGTVHNIYTIRGAAVRNAHNWSKQINAALYRFGQEAEGIFASHSWPRWGSDRIQEVLRAQRDAYANLNNQSLHYATTAASPSTRSTTSTRCRRACSSSGRCAATTATCRTTCAAW